MPPRLSPQTKHLGRHENEALYWFGTLLRAMTSEDGPLAEVCAEKLLALGIDVLPAPVTKSQRPSAS